MRRSSPLLVPSSTLSTSTAAENGSRSSKVRSWQRWPGTTCAGVDTRAPPTLISSTSAMTTVGMVSWRSAPARRRGCRRRSTNLGVPNGPSEESCELDMSENCPRRLRRFVICARAQGLVNQLRGREELEADEVPAHVNRRPHVSHSDVQRGNMSVGTHLDRVLGLHRQRKRHLHQRAAWTDVVKAHGLGSGQRARQPSDYLEPDGGATVGHTLLSRAINYNSVSTCKVTATPTRSIGSTDTRR